MLPTTRKSLLFLIAIFLAFPSNAEIDSAIEAANRLRPIDTSSPRALVVSLQHYAEEIMESFVQGDRRSVRRKVQRAIRIFDFSDTPPTLIDQQGPEHFWQLIDILGRLPKLETSEIPGIEQVKEEEITSWTWPNTELTVHMVAEGPRRGDFLMSPETFERLPDFWEEIADIPKRPDSDFPVEAYRLYRSGVNTVFPEAIISKLPEVLQKNWLGQPGWKWPVLILALGLVMLLAWPFARLRPKHVDQPRDDTLDAIVTVRRLALPIYILFAMQILDYLFSRQIRLTGMALEVGEIAVQVVSLIAVAYILNLLMSLAAEGVVKFLHTRQAGFDSQLIRLAFRILFWVITLMVIAVISEQIGVPVAALAAGIGVGGLAFALAAQSTLENLVAGLTIYGDRPIRVGELCDINGVSGTVESIGLRSTRLRTFARTVVTIPNAEVAKHRLENFALRDRMLMETTLGLRYETTPDQLRYVLGKLRELLYAHPKVIDDGMRVRFVGFGACSLDIGIFAYIKATAKPAFLEVCEDLNLRIMDIVDEAGVGFAFPSQTAYLARDKAPDTERVRAAEARVATWRESGELPFPDLSDDAQEAVGDTLDFPPLGSPGNKPVT